MKVLLKRFHLNGNTIGFHPQIQKLELHTKQIVPCESTAEEVSFELKLKPQDFIHTLKSQGLSLTLEVNWLTSLAFLD